MNLIVETALEIWQTLSQMAPYLLLGFAVSGFLAAFLSPAVVERHLGGKHFGPVLKASLFGIPLPLCSCGVIPVAVSLRKHGAGRGATTAFLLSTPQTGADSIMVTYSLLGPMFATFRPLAALLTGLLGGTLVDLCIKENAETEVPSCDDSCCSSSAPHTRRLTRGLHHGFISLPKDIGGAMLIGIVLAALITAFVPQSWIESALTPGIASMLVMMVVGIPVYVCATASVPIAAALITKGLSPGAALVFLMTGPATNGAAIATIWRALGGRTALLYLVTVAVSALLCGFALDHLLIVTETTSHVQTHAVLPQWGHTACAVVLLVILVNAWLGNKLHLKRRHTNHSEETGQRCCAKKD